LGFPTAWSFTTHKDCLLHVSLASAAFDFHIGTSKFDVKIYDGTQCQKKYEAEVHFH
jgi:hypothetical protein